MTAVRAWVLVGFTFSGAVVSCSSDGGSSASGEVTCEGSCNQIAALRCPGPLPSSIVDSCFEKCAEYRSFDRYAECESLINGYYSCISAPGNTRCDGTDSFETVDDCRLHIESANDCLSIGAQCPATTPVDCGVGCCPIGYRCGVNNCVRDQGAGGSGGVGGAGTGGSGVGGSGPGGTGGGGTGGVGGVGGSGGASGVGGASGSAGFGGAGGSGAACSVLASADACESCLESRCCPSLNFCDSSPGCLECLQSGSMGPDCSGSTRHFDVRSCSQRECSAECASKGYCNALPDGTCESCLEASCCQELLDCFADPTCSGCIDFQLSLCATKVEFQALVECGNTACGAGCPG